jgi:hypothetical protein
VKEFQVLFSPQSLPNSAALWFLCNTHHIIVRACPSVQLPFSQRAVVTSDERLFPRPMEVKRQEIDEIQIANASKAKAGIL